MEITVTSKPNVTTTQARLMGLMDTMLTDSKIPPVYHGVIRNLVNNYLKNANEAELRTLLTQLKDVILPWVINGQ